MSNTVYNKATFNGQTIIDLSQDTVTSAAHIVSGHTGHLADGTQVAGTAIEGVDMPVFTLVMDQDSWTVTSATCDRSYAEFKAYMDEQPSTDAFCMATISDPIVGDITGNLMVLVMQTSSYITCAFMNGFKPVSDIRYNSNGTITVTSPSSAAQTLTITENGTYQPESDYKSLQEVVVNVPATTSSLQSKSATPSETAQTITADSGYDGLSSVEVGAISSTYVGSGVTRQAATTITPSESSQTAVASGVYTTGAVTVGAISSTYVGSGVTRQAAKTVTPTESSQTAVASGVYTTGAVTVGAVSSTYVGSGIDRNDSSDLTASGATVTAPAGYYEEAATKSVASGSATTPATTVTANPSISVSSSGLITATASATKSVTPTVSVGYVSSGTAGTITVSGSNTQQLTTQGATTYNTSTTDQTIASGRYLTGTQTIKAVTTANITAANVKAGTTVTVGDANDADRILSVTGTYTSDATASASDIIDGETAYVNGTKVAGTLAVKTIYTQNAQPGNNMGNNGDICIVIQ